MKCMMIKMRRAGIAVPRHDLKNQIRQVGIVVVLNVRDDGVHRVIKTARLKDESYGKNTDVLDEPHIVRVSEGGFDLQGFERVHADGKVTEYAQSWLCRVEFGEAAR